MKIMVRTWECQARRKVRPDGDWSRGGVPVHHAVTSTTLWEVLKLGVVIPLTFLPLKERVLWLFKICASMWIVDLLFPSDKY